MPKQEEPIITAENIEKMKDGVIILNTARGALINEFDLAVALKVGKVYAAGIDVLSSEPPDRNNPLLTVENCIITPHIAWSAKAARERLINIAYLNLEAFLNGERVNRIV
jgi:glycerate dehydrogenase